MWVKIVMISDSISDSISVCYCLYRSMVYVYVCCFYMLFFSLLSAWRSALPWEASPVGGAFSSCGLL